MARDSLTESYCETTSVRVLLLVGSAVMFRAAASVRDQ